LLLATYSDNSHISQSYMDRSSQWAPDMDYVDMKLGGLLGGLSQM